MRKPAFQDSIVVPCCLERALLLLLAAAVALASESGGESARPRMLLCDSCSGASAKQRISGCLRRGRW
eukprot:9338006-Alexandrium_andersonii.AAC.2